ncbi:MAG TPA: aldose 1-epimerase [Bryobacteraceae bacterium]|nr:aldose 1-epimerase [Bryobacteraceae bacterium]
MKAAAFVAVALPLMTQAANYTAQRMTVDGIEIVRLTDESHKAQVSIVPSVGNNAYEFLVNGKNILWFPQKSLADFKTKPAFSGNPFLAPWANRLDHDGFYANGKHYSLDAGLNNVRRDGAKQPIHGLVTNSSQWKVTAVSADASSAQVTSRLEFWRNPDYMAQFPFAHSIDMTYRLHDGILEVETTIENHSTEGMPVSVGYHPYFRLYDSPRNAWKVSLPAKQSYVLSASLVATGETKPMPYSNPQPLQGIALDDVLGGLTPGESGRTEFAVEGVRERIAVLYGPKYPVAVVYSPADRDFICFEPMTGPTNAFNLKQAGKYDDLQTIPAGGKWRESFWIHPTGF